MEWVVVGSAPSVLETISKVPGGLATITCNGGLGVVARPDVYLCNDSRAGAMFESAAREAKAGGTRCVTALKEWELQPHMDFYETYDLGGARGEPTREKWGVLSVSGGSCVEWVLRSGATKVWMVGMDGYTGKDDYFDGIWRGDGTVNRAGKLTERLRNRLQRLAEVFDDVEFIQVGEPVYRVEAENWLCVGK